MKRLLKLDYHSIVKTETFRQSTLTFIATLINGVFGMVFYILLAREFGPFTFGLFSISITVLTLVADIGNLGINIGIVNFVSKYFKSDYKRSLKFLKLGLYSKISLGFTFLLIGLLSSPFIANIIFNKPELVVPMKLVFIGVGTTWLFSFTTSYYQAAQKFISWGVVQIFTNFIRLILIVYLLSVSKLSLNLAIICYITTPFIGFIIGFVNITTNFLKEKIDGEIKREFFNYNKWVAVSSGIAAFSSRTDTFVLGRLAEPSGIGIYSAANQLVQIVPQLIGAIGTVVAPKYSSFTNDREMIEYLKKIQIMVGGIALFILLCTPIVRLIINYFFGVEYISSFGVFIILLIGMLIFLVSIPIHNAIIYYYSYPKLFSYLSLVNLLVVFSLSIYFTVKFGYQTTAYAVLLGNLVNFVIPLIWFLRKIKFNQKSSLNKLGL